MLAPHCKFNRQTRGPRSEAIQKYVLRKNALDFCMATEITVSMELGTEEAHQLSESEKLH